MTEKRSDYRKKIKHKKNKQFLNSIKTAFEDNEVDVNPAFTRETEKDSSVSESVGRRESQQYSRTQDINQLSEEKGLRLKRKLNHAILIVLTLIILVLFALFHL
ncbi:MULTISPECIES: hypothetical protein [unclassified Lactobacillus]|uniref:hypothetical protein n=1 Tax=unclassified Lactobacillus TaxID=2620435 RepID=UPI000EFAFFC6|nr:MULTISPECIES: hypothetical protein [unclassified Lactobacillus]RMC25115.1 hypothetical protein F5ESL0247_03345 [Lactobacillus sp. ESL0247]RMC29270.1 hypothetical protein F5ESL0246_03345 [Lactobacillus sp. ESL0246]RMC32290.1 hypothetical protein F5ESL0245_03350 [Lactobacillus sp. ESL0245]RMC48706.1 hypothetical protein F5ESL0228_03640 [Lactobacillus sp. ESL0228]